MYQPGRFFPEPLAQMKQGIDCIKKKKKFRADNMKQHGRVLKKYLFAIINYVYMCVPVWWLCTHTHVHVQVPMGARNISQILLQLQFQAVASCPLWLLRTKFRSSAAADYALNN